MNTLSSKENNAFEILFQIYCLSFNYFLLAISRKKIKKKVYIGFALSLSLSFPLSVGPFVRYNKSRNAERIFVKFDIGQFW